MQILFPKLTLLARRDKKGRLLSQLSESDTDFMIVQNNLEVQTGSGINTMGEKITSIKTKNRIQTNISQVDVHTNE